MIATIEVLDTFNYSKVRFYTLKFEERHRTEFEDFVQRMMDNAMNAGNMTEISKWIEKIGQRGAEKHYFKHERAAEAIPLFYETEHPDSPFGIRLYAIRLSNSIVVLLNGDLKTADKAEDCENVKPHFRLANKVAKKLNDCLGDEIELRPKKIEFLHDDFHLEL